MLYLNRHFSRQALWCLAIASMVGCSSVSGVKQPSKSASARASSKDISTITTATTSPNSITASSPQANSAVTAGVTNALPAFDDVITGATMTQGLLPIWTREDKIWLEIPAKVFDQPLFMGASLAQGLGQHYFWPGLMHFNQVVSFRRIGNNVQLIALNLQTQAPSITPLERAVAESYSDSLLVATPLAAGLHPQRKSGLIDATAWLGGDIPGIQTRLENVYRMPYALDRSNSYITRVKGDEKNTSISVRSHYVVPKLPAVRPISANPTPNDSAPNPPSVVPDARSLFLTHVYTFSPLPTEPMKPRLADQRVGYFTESHWNLGQDTGIEKRTHYIRRWRLKKQDPKATISEPKKPIRVVMDKNIPVKWRNALKEGVLEWNKAFEAAGFRNALAIEQQSDDSDASTLEGTGILALRWFTTEGEQTAAVGPSQADPRTGEILRAAAIIPENWARLGRLRIQDTQPHIKSNPPPHQASTHAHEYCTYATDALDGISTAFELMVMRGLIDPQGPEAERFIYQSLKDVTMHEIGHALGLRHNFKGSTGINHAQLRNPEFTGTHGISNSVMDYNGLNLGLEDETIADIHMNRLGAYDQWAIEWGYREYSDLDEKRELSLLAAKSDSNLALAYATDEDAATPDPLVNRFDLSDDPLEYAQRQITLARELWQRTTQRSLEPDDDMSVYRRNLQRVLNIYQAAAALMARHIGGTLTSRHLASAQKPLFEPESLTRQRKALINLTQLFFNAETFRFDPTILSRLGLDQLERAYAFRSINNQEFNLAQSIAQLQRMILDALISDTLAVRLADAQLIVSPTKATLSYTEVQRTVLNSIWTEVINPPMVASNIQSIDGFRRNLQREYLRRIVNTLLRSSAASNTETISIHRHIARQLQTRLQTTLQKHKWDSASQLHLENTLHTLNESLSTAQLRTSP